MPLNFSLSRYMRFFRTQLIMPLIALVVWRIGGDEWISWSAGLLVLWVSIVSFMAVRWHALNRAFAAGDFTENEMRANPKRYVFGSTSVNVSWICATVAMLVAVASWFQH